MQFIALQQDTLSLKNMVLAAIFERAGNLIPEYWRSGFTHGQAGFTLC